MISTGIDKITRRPGQALPSITRATPYVADSAYSNTVLEFIRRTKYPPFGAKKVNLSVPYYDEVKLDLNQDIVVDGLDKALDLRRAADLTWSIGFTHDLDGGDTQLPDMIDVVPTSGTFSPLAKGAVYGVEVTYRSGGN